jgi:hypothetical protein
MQAGKNPTRTIKADGEFAIVTFKVKDTAAKGVTVLKEDPDLKISMFKGINMELPYDVQFGNINIK